MRLRAAVRRLADRLRGRALTEHDRDLVKADQQRSIGKAWKHFSSRV